MRFLMIVPMLALFVFVGCGESEPEEPPPPATTEPPKKTADQLYQETMTKINPTMNPNNPRALPLLAIVNDVRKRYHPPGEPNGEEALSRIRRNLNQRFDAAGKAEQWRLVVIIAAPLDQFAKGPPERTGDRKSVV